MPDVTLNSGQSSSNTRTVRMSCFQGDNRQCGTEEGEPIVFVFWFTCCKIVYWLLMLSSVIVSGRYIAWYDPCSGHRSHNHFSNKNWKFIAVTSDLQCVWIFQMSETTLHNSYFYLWVLTLFAELPRVEQNGSGTSPSSNVLPLGQLLCLPGMHCLRRSINCSPKRRKKKTVPLCTHRWTQHGMMANSCIILFSTYGDSAFLGTRRPLRAKALTNSGACLFAFSAGALQSQTGRLGFHSPSGRGLVSSVMDRPVVLHAEIPSSFREQEGRTSTSSITLTLTFCALAAGGDEESCPRISLATFFFVTSHEGAAYARNTCLSFVTQLRRISKTVWAPTDCAVPLGCVLLR